MSRCARTYWVGDWCLDHGCRGSRSGARNQRGDSSDRPSGSESGNEPSPESSAASAEPSTTAAEAAQIEGELRAWKVVFDGTSERAKECEIPGESLLDEDCAQRIVSAPVDEADAKLTDEVARLIPVVAPGCARALKKVNKEISEGGFVFLATDDALEVCKATE